MSMTDAEIREAMARAERAYEELMRVTGMGKYAKRVQGGPPNPPRCSIPARPDYDTDLLIGESLDNVPRLAADLLAARAERDEARADRDEARSRVEYPWCPGCKVTVTRCDEDRCCLSCGVDLIEQSARAETAEARCRELEAERAIFADYLRDTDADFRARRPSDRAVLDALLSPPPPHTCQIHRATSGASDCGLEPCEEAKVHRDRGAARPPHGPDCHGCGGAK